MGNRIFVHINETFVESAIVVTWQNISSSANFKEIKTDWNYRNVLHCEIVLQQDLKCKPTLETGQHYSLFFSVHRTCLTQTKGLSFALLFLCVCV